MSKVRWAIQYTELNNYNVDKWAEAAGKSDLGFVRPVYSVPDAEDLSDMIDFEEDGTPTIFVGSVSLMKLLRKNSKGFSPAYFFDEEKSRFDWVTQHNQRYMLNGDAKITTLDSIEYLLNTHKSLFVRPVGDFKQFNGGVVHRDRLIEWDMELQRFGIHKDFYNVEVVYASPKNIEKEYRAFLIGGEPIDIMQYMYKGKIRIDPITQDEFKAMAGVINQLQLPHENCVVDLTYHDSQFKVLEINCWNASGLYEHNVDLLVEKMNEYILERWQSG